MSVRRDTPRGPTSEQLRRRALAHENVVQLCRHEPVFEFTAGVEYISSWVADCRKCGRAVMFFPS